MKACATMSTFSPSEGMVDTIIPFTKTTYAQTISQKFYPPKPFRLPSMKEKKKFQAAELGMKVACGLEMLYHNSRSHHNQSHLSIETYDFEADKKFLAYLAQLNTLGYFKGQKEGSKLHKILTEQAKQQYLIFKRQEHPEKVNQIALEDLDVDDEETFEEALSVPHPRQTIDTLLSGYSDEALERLTMNSSKESEDSDDWINVDPQQLEELLMKRIGTMNQSMMADLQNDLSSSRPGSKEAEEGIDLERMMASFENFVENSQSGVDGVEFPNDMNEFSDTDEDEEDEGAIQFDMEEFMRILKGTQGSEEDLTQVMKEMDQEVLSHQKIGGSFAKLPSKQNEDEQEEDEDAPVDVQLNLVKNVLESFKSQQGLPGPVGNMLSQFGFVLPGDTEENDE
ncbi:SGT1 protein-domain-containing protein [Blakeslea trispora]|nr:SGT1 protein-domain-containing protein [Blakeslea trispora]